MAWIRWRTERSTGRKIAHLQWREAGRIRSRSLESSDPELARLAMARMKRDEPPPADTDALSRKFWAHLDTDRAPATVQWYRGTLGPLLTAWSTIPLRAWTRPRFEAYLRAHREAWSPRTAGMLVQCARVFVRWARGAGLTVPDFVTGVRAPHMHHEEPDHLTGDELAALLEAAHGTRLEPAVALCALGGLRPAEMLAVTAGDVLARPPALRVRGTKTHSDRRIPIGPRLAEILGRHRGEGPVVQVPAHRSNLRRELRGLCRRAGIREVSWYALRHTFATERIAEGVDLPTLQALMGHRPGSTVTLRYLHTDAARMAAAVRKA
jgi:integrase